MKRFLLASAIVAVSFLIASAGALADVKNGQPGKQAQGSGHGAGNIRQPVTPGPVVELEPVALPQTTSSGGSGSAAAAKAGPVSAPVASRPSEGSGSNSFEGMLTPRGGAMSSPEQRADREIRRLIRKLD